MIGGSIFALGSAAVLYATSDSKSDDSEKSLLLDIINDIKTEYIPIYAHAYIMYINSMKELKDRPDFEKFIAEQIQDQSKDSFLNNLDHF